MTWLFLALWLATQPATAPIAAEWHADTLIVQSAPGCLYLVGNGRPNALVGCDQPQYTLLPYGDQNYVPMGRTLALRNELAQTITGRLVVPPRVRVGLPLITNAP